MASPSHKPKRKEGEVRYNNFSKCEAINQAARDINETVDKELVNLRSKARRSHEKMRQVDEIEKKRQKTLSLLKEMDTILLEQEEESKKLK